MIEIIGWCIGNVPTPKFFILPNSPIKWLVSQFEVGEKYPEAMVNEIIQRHHPNFATLRREFIMNKLMERENGVYWRIA
jgi:hypothetical protein